MPSLRKINPLDRQCYFIYEKQLLYFKHYTRRNCEMECDAQLMLQLCNCIPYNMPKIYDNATICFLNDMECLVEAEKLMFDPRSQKCKESCLSGCHELSFYPDTFVTPLAANDYNFPSSFFRNVSREWMHDNLALVEFFFQENIFRGNIKVPYTGFTEFLC